jgi:hypothetical protein
MTATVRIVERGGTGKPPPPFEVSSRKSFAPGKGESIRTAESAAMREIARRIVYSLAREW